mmetsp:Transcript_52040/g.123913  ORF Transcript_52040/g.123913 Transcript_52040/m.123913 type:complete len:488 (+) Transcript_52040:121-1584(+)
MEELCAAIRPHWQKDAVHLPGLNCLDFGLRDLYQLFVMTGQKRVEEAVGLTFKNQEQVGGYPSLFHAYLHGASVVINHAEATFPPLLEWCQKLRKHFVPHAYMNLYLTPAGAQTVRPHSDDRDVILLQCLGRKKWKVMEPVIPFPYSHEQVGKDTPLDENNLPRTVLSCTVEAGDALYMPRGFVHVGESTSDGPSLHLTLAIATHDWSYAKLLADVAFAASVQKGSVTVDIGSGSDKLTLPQDDDTQEVESMLQTARTTMQGLVLDDCKTSKEIAVKVQATFDSLPCFKTAVPFSIYFAEGGPKCPVHIKGLSGKAEPVSMDASSGARIAEAMTTWSLREAYRERLEKHNRWHDELLNLWQTNASKSSASSADSSSTTASEGTQPGAGPNFRWIMPPRLDHEVALAKAGRFSFSCRLVDESETMEILFQDEQGRTLRVLTLPMYLDVMKFVERQRDSFTVGELPVPDPVGQLCFAAVSLHNGIFIDV